ncbi:MAG TPA: metal ABC transporter ATP-binding protein [Chloroflexi bacterium]|nr:metal ABC transporter ATP-binding protein [Chloroflexota bacterium]
MQDVITLRHVWAGYEDDVVLEDINFSVRPDDFIGLIGPNGGGKTTLMRVLLGLVKPLRGQVSIMGKPPELGREHIGYVPQIIDFDRSFPITLFDVVRMGRLGHRKLFHRYNAQDNEIAMAALRDVEMESLKDTPIGELSGGQRQRVLIARALASQPQILLLDEPTSSIDPKVSTSIYELLQRLNERMAIILVSHDMNAISSYVKTIGCVSRKLFYHAEKAVTAEMLEAAYQCPIDLIAHGLPHRHLEEHVHEEAAL